MNYLNLTKLLNVKYTYIINFIRKMTLTSLKDFNAKKKKNCTDNLDAKTGSIPKILYLNQI